MNAQPDGTQALDQDSRRDTSRLIAFFGLTFAVSWLLWLPSVLRSNEIVALPEIVGLFGQFVPLMPSVVALLLVAREDGRAGVSRLLKRAVQIDFNPVWFIPTLLLPPLIGLLTRFVMRTTGNEVLNGWEAPSLVTAVGTFFFILVAGGGLEEFGWRGYALGRLQKQQSALTASLVLGVLWGLWHLPLHFISGTTQAHIPVWQFVLRVAVNAILFTWLFNNTRGSVLIPILFHTVGNTTSALLPPFFATSFGRWTNFSILVVIVVIVVGVWGPKTLVRGTDTAELDPAVTA